MFEPMRVTARLACGAVCDGSLPLDALLNYQSHREEFGAEIVTVPGAEANANPGSRSLCLPLMRVNEETPLWHYAASFAVWEGGLAEGTNHWVGSFDLGLSDLVDFGKLKARVEIGSGRYRSYRMPMRYMHSPVVRWYAVGHVDSVRRLLTTLTHVGKKVSQGWGCVLSWDVEAWPEDWSVQSPLGLMRSVPDPEGVLWGFRPSYWLRSNQTRCLVPLLPIRS